MPFFCTHHLVHRWVQVVSRYHCLSSVLLIWKWTTTLIYLAQMASNLNSKLFKLKQNTIFLLIITLERWKDTATWSNMRWQKSVYYTHTWFSFYPVLFILDHGASFYLILMNLYIVLILNLQQCYKYQMNTPSGNSFNNLIPFAKYPYKYDSFSQQCLHIIVICFTVFWIPSSNFLISFRESEFGTEEIAESVKEEKMRKQMEAIAEDLFKYEKVRMHFI